MIQFYRTRDPYGFLSNYAETPIELDGLLWPSVEHYYQAQKFPHDAALREQIRACADAFEAKQLAWQHAAIRADWESVRDDVMRTALRAKFSQNMHLGMALLATGETKLIEHTKRDSYWGDGGDGSGVNRMGELLASIRAELAAAAQPGVNRVLLNWLLECGSIELIDSPFLRTPPPACTIAWPRVEGMLLGIAIGDALGNASEGQNPGARMAARGEIRDYVPNQYADWRAVGVPSDDTQLAFRTLAQLVADGRLIPQALAERFCSGQIFGIGQAVREFVDAFSNKQEPWQRAGTASAGNGALMRIAPVLVPYIHAPSAELWADTALAAMITHNDSASIASCVAFTAMLWELLAMTQPPAPAWWRTRFVEIVTQLEVDTTYRPRSPHVPQMELPFSAWIDKYLSDPDLAALSTLEACNRWYSAAFLLETVPSALLILQRYAHDPEEAIVRAVNDTRDNDTIAAIVGAAVGALHGVDALPARWRDGLLGRLSFDDDGALFALIDAARTRWGDCGLVADAGSTPVTL